MYSCTVKLYTMYGRCTVVKSGCIQYTVGVQLYRVVKYIYVSISFIQFTVDVEMHENKPHSTG